MSKIIVQRCLIFGLASISPVGLAQPPADMSASMAEDVGSEYVTFRTSCDEEIANDVNRGVALMHSFWFSEAIETFEQVLEQDPDCAMAHWGIALSHWGNPFAGQRNPQQLDRGRAAIEQAQATGSPTERERAYINAVTELFADHDPGTQYQRTMAYADAMTKLAESWPEDTEARIFKALAINQTARPDDQTYSRQLEATAILEPLFEENPNHPGIAHYIVHAYDHPPLAERGLDAALRYASLAPDAPHALHMPSHIFTRIGMWQESIDTNKRSAAAASSAGEELHALDYKVYAYLQTGRDAEAAEVVARSAELLEKVDVTAVGATQAGAFAIAAIPARYALERQAWTEAAALDVHPAEMTPHTQAMSHFARAIGAARSGLPAAAAADIEALATLRQQLVAMQDDYWAEQVNIQWQVARAWMVFANGQHDQGLALMQAAAEAEDSTEKSAVSPGPLAPARELLGTMLLEADMPHQSMQAFQATTENEPNRFLGLYGAGRAAEAIGDEAEARDYYQRLLEVAAAADTDRPELRHARMVVTDSP